MTARSGIAQLRHGTHPSVGNIVGGYVQGSGTNPNILGTSTMFSPPNRLWDHGEGFIRDPSRLPAGYDTANTQVPADTGGYHSFDDGSDVSSDDVRVTSLTCFNPVECAEPVQGWQNSDEWPVSPHEIPAGVQLRRLTGYLWPSEFASSDPGNGFDARTVFELFMPQQFDPQEETVVILSVHPTIASQDGSLWGYRGVATNDYQSGLELIDFGIPLTSYPGAPTSLVVRDLTPSARLAAMSGRSESGNKNIIAGYIMPPITNGHLLMTAQRVLQFERAIRWIFDSDPENRPVPLPLDGDVPTGPFPVIVSGGSNGGQVAMQLAAMFPHRIHAACSTQFPMSMRRHLGEEAAWTFISSLQGFANSGEGFRQQYVMPYGALFSILGTDWAGGDTFHLWQAGLVQRPIYALASDEDYTWTGIDLHLLTSPTPAAGTPLPGVAATATSALGSDPFHWSLADKECHQASARFTYPASLATGISPVELRDQALAPLGLIAKAIQEANSASQPSRTLLPVPIAVGTPGSGEGDPVAAFDPFHHAFYRESTLERRAMLPSGSTTLLAEDLGFNAAQNGLGTWLGVQTSLDVDDQNRIYVGSADGVVTRLVKNPTDNRLLIDTRCVPAGGDPHNGPFSLGYAVSALDAKGNKLAVATFGRIYVYDTSGPLLENPLSVKLPWLEQRPDQLQIVDDMFGPGGTFVAYHTWLGEFVVRDATDLSSVVVSATDPTMFRFVVDEAATPPSGRSKPVWVSSSRGHVMQCEFVSAGGSWTDFEVRHASEWFGRNGPIISTSNAHGRRIAFLYEGQKLSGRGLYFFDPNRTTAACDPSEILDSPLPVESIKSQHSAPNDLSLVELSGGEFHEYVALVGTHLFYYTSASATEKFEFEPDSFTPLRIPSLHYPTAIAAADLDGDGTRDLIVATQNGQVTWIPSDWLRVPNHPGLADFSREVLGDEWFGVGLSGFGAAKPDKHSTGSNSATWGITLGIDEKEPTVPRVQVIDLCARRSALDPGTGAPEFLHTVPMEVWQHPFDPSGDPNQEFVGAFPAPKPFRGLAWFGGVTGEELLSTDPQESEVLVRDAGERPLGPFSGPGGVSAQRLLLHTPYDCAVAPLSNTRVTPDFQVALFPESMFPTEVRSVLHTQIFCHGYLPFAYGGDVLMGQGQPPSRVHCFFWGGNMPSDAKGATTQPAPLPPILIQRADSFDVVRGIVYDQTPIAPTLSEWGTSTTGDSQQSFRQAHLRTADPVESLSAQSLRAAWCGSSPARLRVLAGTAGGSLHLLDGEADIDTTLSVASVALDESADHGYGGSALAVADLLDNQSPLIFFGTLFANAGSGDMVSSLHTYQVGGSNYDTLVSASPMLVFDGSGPNRPKLFGLCGIALGNLDPPGTDQDGVEEELVLTTLNGDVVVFELAASGSQVVIGNMLYHQVFDGAMGASNSIVFLNDPQTVPTIYIASSMGTRKLTRSL